MGTLGVNGTGFMARNGKSRHVVYAALIGNMLVAATKFVAAAMTGSSSMLSEAIHSVVDSGNEGLLLYGYRRSARSPDEKHPLGYGRELYFWSLVVALLLFVMGGGFAIYEGLSRIVHPFPVTHLFANYCVLGASALFEGGTWIIALKAFQQTKQGEGYLEAIEVSKDPPAFMVLLEDTAALAGLALSAAGLSLSEWLQAPQFDGAASLVIGLMLTLVALIVARESKDLLIGERAHQKIDASIKELAQREPEVERVNGVLTLHLSPDQIVAALSLEFVDDIRTTEIETAIVSMERRIRKLHPEIVSIFVKPQAHQTFRQRRKAVEQPRSLKEQGHEF
ncbi:cation diffusion facilitator family transporter [Labrys sp. LIt4]|uniref:cation diffusion facilitator family transporter n=1 Tax=Labrys sp. LIt4 TaxID=2821355 RepID=UPI0032AEBE5B